MLKHFVCHSETWFVYCTVDSFCYFVLYASARNKSYHFNDRDKKNKHYWQSLDQFSLYFSLWNDFSRAEMACSCIGKLLTLCFTLRTKSPGTFLFLFNVSYAHNELYRLAMLWTSGTHFLCRCVEFITRITTTIDQTNYILEILIFRYVVLMWSYQCICLDFSSSFSTP